ncbi:MAG: SMP-30/gluconolactonase/LRE family protein [Terriglobia bacterium]|nr:SMP-30/gluconolactonase/LRE family protein [Terriglobia bacterium]
MLRVCKSRSIVANWLVALVMLLVGAVVLPGPAYAGKKNKKQPTSTVPQRREPALEDFDLSKIVFPNPPSIARIRTIGYYVGEKIERDAKKEKPRSSWMDRLAGSKPVMEDKNVKIPFQLIAPNGIAVDSKGTVYTADYRVGAIFMFNPETKESHLIKDHVDANFKTINGLAIDDGDRLFVSDSGFHRILVFGPDHKLQDTIEGGLITPDGLAVDNENRFLYVADVDLDQVLVYDLDSFKLIRKIGTTGKNHELTDPGQFAWPTGVAVDSDDNLYVTDTLNDRVEIFDADGNFISTFGKNCDAPGCFQRPKGIAIDSDGHIWVTDTMAARVQVFNRKGQLLIYFGGYGKYPGEFTNLCSIYIDKNNRVFTSEMQPGRIQIFRYVTDAEAKAEKKQREEERTKKAGELPPDKAPAEKGTVQSGSQKQNIAKETQNSSAP